MDLAFVVFEVLTVVSQTCLTTVRKLHFSQRSSQTSRSFSNTSAAAASLGTVFLHDYILDHDIVWLSSRLRHSG